MMANQMHGAGGWVHTITLPPPSLKDNTADAERLKRALQAELQLNDMALDIDPALLQRLPDVIGGADRGITCTLFKDRRRWLLLGLHDPAGPGRPLGLAVDLGTTNLVLRIIDMARGRLVAEDTIPNPQLRIGPDILTRLHHAEQRSGADDLRRCVLTGINAAVDRLCRQHHLSPADILAAVVAGNTAMTHLILGLPTHRLIREPYIPVVNRPGILGADRVGIDIGAHGPVYFFPNIGSYFGGDVIAGILYSGLFEREAIGALVDVGTNAEVVLGNRDWLIGCAGAAGPALEGGVTDMGMMAGPGVIDGVAYNPATRRFDIHTIDDLPPKGICGSGLIDLASELFSAGMIDFRGQFVAEACGPHLIKRGRMAHFVLAERRDGAGSTPMTISQADLDSLIRSKAAMYTILETVAHSVGIELTDIDTFYVAGTFGTYIRPDTAVTLGMLPDLPRDRYQALGNSAIEGATLALTSLPHFELIDRIWERMTYLELNVNQEFMNRFSAAKFLPHTDPDRFPSVATRRGTHQRSDIQNRRI